MTPEQKARAEALRLSRLEDKRLSRYGRRIAEMELGRGGSAKQMMAEHRQYMEDNNKPGSILAIDGNPAKLDREEIRTLETRDPWLKGFLGRVREEISAT